MLRFAYGGPGGVGDGTAGFFPPERRTRTRLFEELGQVGEKSPTQAQRTETKVIIRRSRLDRVA